MHGVFISLKHKYCKTWFANSDCIYFCVHVTCSVSFSDKYDAKVGSQPSLLNVL